MWVLLAHEGNSRVQIQKEVVSDLKRENQFLSKRVCMNDI
jgi:hypothetical protein